jgi:hypothetical protein
MSNITRTQRESRAFSLILASGGFGVAAVVLIVLSIVGIGSFGFGVIAAVIAVVLYLMLRRTLKL